MYDFCTARETAPQRRVGRRVQQTAISAASGSATDCDAPTANAMALFPDLGCGLLDCCSARPRGAIVIAPASQAPESSLAAPPPSSQSGGEPVWLRWVARCLGCTPAMNVPMLVPRLTDKSADAALEKPPPPPRSRPPPASGTTGMAFDEAAAAAKTIPKGQLSPTQMLELYGLYKRAADQQASETPQPSPMQLQARAKWDAWNAVAHLSPDEARAHYCSLVERYTGSGSSAAEPPDDPPQPPQPPAPPASEWVATIVKTPIGQQVVYFAVVGDVAFQISLSQKRHETFAGNLAAGRYAALYRRADDPRVFETQGLRPFGFAVFGFQFRFSALRYTQQVARYSVSVGDGVSQFLEDNGGLFLVKNKAWAPAQKVATVFVASLGD